MPSIRSVWSTALAVLLQVIVAFIDLCQSQSCTHGDIRLEDGPTLFEGRVEICLNGQWNTVCNDFWGHNEALVVCGQLGFSTSGTETFIDLRITGGPDTGIDNANCTGLEDRLIDCDFSLRVGDCEGEDHKVGLRCHEERLPQNPMLSISETRLKVEWAHPEEGITNETVHNYNVECSILQDDGRVYTLKQTVCRDTLVASLPNIVQSSSTTHYNCCVEAEFQTYSSKACSVPSITTIEPQSTRSTAAVTRAMLVTDMQDSESPIIGFCNSSVQVVAGVLGSVIAILIILLSIAVIALVYRCGKLKRNYKEKDFLSVASDVNKDRVLDNPTYGEGENNSSNTNKDLNRLNVNSQSYHSNGCSIPAYEPVYADGENDYSNAQTTTIQPALYEVPFIENSYYNNSTIS